MGQSLGRREDGGGGGEGGPPRLSRAKNTIIVVVAVAPAGAEDFPLRQQCTTTWAAAAAAATMKRCAVYPIESVGTEVSFAYQPEVRMDVQAHRILHIPSALANSTDICMLYHELCRRIYAADQEGGQSGSSGSGRGRNGGEEEEEDEEDDDEEGVSDDGDYDEDDENSPCLPTDVCLWIAPYVEVRMERNMNGVMQRRIVKGSRRRGRLRNRTLLVKWMLECSDWQEQLARNFWGLPKRGVGRDVTLPWFSLEVEYRPNGRRKLFDAHRHEFGARDITWEMFRHGHSNNRRTTTTTTTSTSISSTSTADEGDDLEITSTATTGTKKVAFADRKTTVEAGEIVPGDRRVTVEASKIVFADGGDMLVVDKPGEKTATTRMHGGIRKSVD